MCTGVKLTAENGGVVYARTLEFGQDLESNILIIPRNYSFVGTSSTQKPGLHWNTKYAVVGANALHQVALLDGVNEKGLAGGLFYFPDYAEFQTISDAEHARAIAPWELLTWLLTSFANIEEIKQHLPTIKVGNIVFGPWGAIPPIHAIVHDSSGHSLVIEYIKGELVMRNNPIGVFTNAPSFDWHLTNLNNYINLTPFNIPKAPLNDITLSALGQGTGMLGLPGDFTSPSRFVRAFKYSQSVVNIKTEADARDAAFHILNLFNIPAGTVRQKNKDGVEYDFTRWTSACDLTNKRYYWHTYANRQIFMVDLMQLNLEALEPVTIAMQIEDALIDATPK